MRCKPGDLALIVDIDFDIERVDLGKVVRVVQVGEDWSAAGDSRLHWTCDTLGQRIHMLDPYLPVWMLSDGAEFIDIADVNLRPLRGEDGVDETLRLVELPREIAAC